MRCKSERDQQRRRLCLRQKKQPARWMLSENGRVAFGGVAPTARFCAWAASELVRFGPDLQVKRRASAADRGLFYRQRFLIRSASRSCCIVRVNCRSFQPVISRRRSSG